MVYMYHSFLIHPSADGHLGCFHVLAIINREALLLKVFGLWTLSLSLCIYIYIIYIHPFKKGSEDLRELESGRSGF